MHGLVRRDVAVVFATRLRESRCGEGDASPPVGLHIENVTSLEHCVESDTCFAFTFARNHLLYPWFLVSTAR
jgi:hypothetical protein